MKQHASSLVVTELEEFSALSLILQHRALVRWLDTLEAAIESCRRSEATDGETAARLLPTLRSFAQALPAHFAAESKSTASLLRDGAEAEYARRLEQLDSEHPQLLVRFEITVEHLTRHELHVGAPLTPLQHVMADLAAAIEAFRRHEAEEDAMFVA